MRAEQRLSTAAKCPKAGDDYTETADQYCRDAALKGSRAISALINVARPDVGS